MVTMMLLVVTQSILYLTFDLNEFITEKKQDMLVRGRREDELVDSFGFALENCVARLELIPCIGLQARDSEYNALGYNRMGIYLCRHADVSLQHSLIKHSGDDIMRLVIYKVRCTPWLC